MTSTSQSRLPVAVIGAGPVGLAAAAHLLARGERPIVLEAGPVAGASILEWAHVRMFSPWAYNIDPASVRLLESTGWRRRPDSDFPTGHDLVTHYLAPLAAHPALAPHLRYDTTVVGISRVGLDRTKTAGREEAPFVLHVRTSQSDDADAAEELLAKAVIDASGTWRTPNPLGASGYPAIGERDRRADLFYGLPDVLGRHRAQYAGRRVLIVGSGHSAMHVLLDLAALARDVPATRLVWVVRRATIDRVFGGGDRDQLPERGRLGARLRQLVDERRLDVVQGFALSSVMRADEGLIVSNGERRVGPVDAIVAATGFRPDLDMLRELRLDLDAIVESPRALAPLIDPNVHSCGTVPPHGAHELQHPEPQFFIVGMKSYGRAPTFLLRTGYEQVRSVVAALSGDWESARRVELTLPDTGVCSVPDAVADALGDAGSACCGTAPTSIVASPVTLVRKR